MNALGGAMRHRWYHWKQIFRANRPIWFAIFLVIVVIVLITMREGKTLKKTADDVFQTYGVRAVGAVLEGWFPRGKDESENWFSKRIMLFSYLQEQSEAETYADDPVYKQFLTKKNAGSSQQVPVSDREQKNIHSSSELGIGSKEIEKAVEKEGADEETGEVIAMKPAGSVVIREKLADYDYLMKNFYSVHPSTTAGRDLVSAKQFLSMDLSLKQNREEPQILIYHTHSQEEYADYPENPNATIVGVGARLAELLRAQGYGVIHDTSVYDVQNGKLDRSQAYTYALDGITGLLQKYPSIEVVLDLHRDGVAEGTRLVKEVNGELAAQIMFFNGISQTPEGPIEYLPNPNRDANMAFSFQMQLLALERYPGLTRKIYLKGLRYNQHVRARTSLIEVGAQTNTYIEALRAMEPLTEMICGVLNGS